MSKEIQKHISELFKIQQLLGSGAYGHVWKAVEKSSKNSYALKKVFDAFQNNVDAQRTYREITILHEIDNPNIVKLKAVIKAKNDKDLYLVFQHMQTDLHSLVGENILEMPHLLYIIYQIFKSLKYLHSAQLVHRDLKPSNILINSDCQIKLCDFGLVRSLTHEENLPLVLSEDVATRWYRSPQMLLGSHEYGWATDVWSIGCILAQLVIGQPLLMGGSNIQQLQKILQLTGLPKPEDIQSIKSSIGQTLIQQFRIFKKPFRHYFKGSKFQSETLLISLIKSMLEFNPEKRITVDQVLDHELFADIRCKKQEVICQKFIAPQLDDNVRLTVDDYRSSIYKDIERRYPEYNLDKEEERPTSIFRFRRGHNSLLNRMSSIDSFPRSKATNSLIRPTKNKESTKNEQQLAKSINQQQVHHSLHCNTIHSSNFYKSAESQMNQKGHNSLYHRKNPFTSIISNNKSIQNKDSTDVSTVIQKSPFRRYKKSRDPQNGVTQIEKISGLCKQNKSMDKGNKENFTTYLSPPKSKLQYVTSKQTCLPSGKFDPVYIYTNTSSPKGLHKKEKNIYKVMEVSNEKKITKKTFTRARRDFIGSVAGESKNSSTCNFNASKILVGED